MLYTYDGRQLAELRNIIAGLARLTPDDIAVRDTAVADGKCSVALWPLWPLALADPALWATVVADERIAEFSVYGLFPGAYDLVYGDDAPAAEVRYDGRTRGRVAIISGRSGGEPASIVIKPRQSQREAEIARIAGELGVGPGQLPTIDGFITEEYVAGTFLTDLAPESATTERMRRIGTALGTAIRSLHHAGICYNDATIADPDGRSHLIVPADGSIRLIDFGVALLLDDHPAGLTFQDAYNAARTDPMFRLFRKMSDRADDAALGKFIAEYGSGLSRQTVAEIQARDWRIADEGATMIASRFGPTAADALRAGMAAAVG